MTSIPSRLRTRRGVVLTESLIAAVVLASVIGLIGPMAVRHGQLRRQASRSQVALDELSNQLDRLTSLSEVERSRALANLEPSKFARQALPEPELSAELVEQHGAAGLRLRLSWAQTSGRNRVVALTAWCAARDEKLQGTDEAVGQADAGAEGAP